MLTAPYDTEAGTPSLILPTREDYANFDVPVSESHRMGEILQYFGVPIQKFVALTVFRSIPNPEADEERLKELDIMALMAAKAKVKDESKNDENSGLIFYLPRKGLSMCCWDNSTLGEMGVDTPEHRAAVEYAKEAYKAVKLEKWHIGRLSNSLRVKFVPR